MFVALVTQHAMRMRRIILTAVLCTDQTYFSTLPHKRQDFREKFSAHVCFDFLYYVCTEYLSF